MIILVKLLIKIFLLNLLLVKIILMFFIPLIKYILINKIYLIKLFKHNQQQKQHFFLKYYLPYF